MAVVRLPRTNGVNAGSIDPEVVVGDPKPRPEKRPEFKVAPAPKEARFVGPLPLAIGLVVLAAGVAFAVRSLADADDPNYLRARDSVAAYESGLPEVERNYDSPIYAEALDALAKVQPASISAGPAADLVADIQAKSAAFHRRVREHEEAESHTQETHDNRNREFLEAHQRDLLAPRKDFPECKEGHAHAH